jgi:hypothetical protein
MTQPGICGVAENVTSEPSLRPQDDSARAVSATEGRGTTLTVKLPALSTGEKAA